MIDLFQRIYYDLFTFNKNNMEKERDGKRYTLFGSSDDAIYNHLNVLSSNGTNTRGKYTFNNDRAKQALLDKNRAKNS